MRCRDKVGRQFIVEMQMLWSSAFMQRVLFNASKAYVRQLGSNIKYELLQPVYSLSLVNDIFAPDLKEYYHDYRIVQVEHTDKVIEGLRFIFVELPKFTPHTSYNDRRMQVLWLRYLTEIDEQTRQVPWDAVRVEKTLVSDALTEGHAKGLAEGRAEGRAESLQETARKMKEMGMRIDIISQVTGLTPSEIAVL